MSQTSSASREAARISVSLGTATRPEPAGVAPGSAWAAMESPAKVSPGPLKRAAGGTRGPLCEGRGGQRHLCQVPGSTQAQDEQSFSVLPLPVANTPFLPGLCLCQPTGLPTGLCGPCRPARCRGRLPPPGL